MRVRNCQVAPQGRELKTLAIKVFDTNVSLSSKVDWPFSKFFIFTASEKEVKNCIHEDCSTIF